MYWETIHCFYKESKKYSKRRVITLATADNSLNAYGILCSLLKLYLVYWHMVNHLVWSFIWVAMCGCWHLMMVSVSGECCWCWRPGAGAVHGLAQAALAHTCSGSGDVNCRVMSSWTPELSQPGPQIHTERKVNIIHIPIPFLYPFQVKRGCF